MKAIVPSFLTICNFMCGMLAVIVSMDEKIGMAVGFIFLGGLFDLFDGRVARKLNVVSPFGKELDSLADVVTFGVAPAMIAYEVSLHYLGWFGLCVVLLYTVCGLVRLARFNVKQSKLTTFIGMPIPAAAICLLTFTLTATPVFLSLAAILLGFLMVSQLRFPNFKKMKQPTELHNSDN